MIADHSGYVGVWLVSVEMMIVFGIMMMMT